MTRWLNPPRPESSQLGEGSCFVLSGSTQQCLPGMVLFLHMAKFSAVLFSALLGSPPNILLMWQVTREGLGLSNLLNTGFCARTCIMTLGISLRNPTRLLRSSAYHRRGEGIEGQKRETCVADLGASKLVSKVSHGIYPLSRLRRSLAQQVRVQAIMSVRQGLG